MTQKLNYDALDAAILSVVRGSQGVKFTQLLASVRPQAEALEDQARAHKTGKTDERPAWRYVDARLQALRRAKKIKYHSQNGWITL